MRKSLSESNIAGSTHRSYMKLAKPALKILEIRKIRSEMRSAEYEKFQNGT